MKRALLQSSAFVRAARRLAKRNPEIAKDLRIALQLLEQDAYHPHLRTPNLHGHLS